MFLSTCPTTSVTFFRCLLNLLPSRGLPAALQQICSDTTCCALKDFKAFSALSDNINAKPLIAFDDKPEIISRLNAASIPTCCISGTHNSVCFDTKLNVVISSYEQTYLENRITALLGKRKWEYSSREARSKRFFNKISWLDIVLKSIFHPIILNKSNFSNVDTGIIYAPNHIRTVDPLVIESIIKTNVHWVALKRFFDGTDSIFNNSKNPLLCSVTKYLNNTRNL